MNPDIVLNLAQQCELAYKRVPTGAEPLHDGQSHPRGFAIKTVAGGMIAFAGSESILDWLTDFYCVQKSVPGIGLVHSGFESEFGKVFGQIISLFRKCPSHYPIQVTGHSLGGALAARTSLALVRDFWFDITCVTLGSPRWCDAEGARHFDRIIPRALRIQHHDDLVPRVPKINYQHTGNLLRIGDDGKEIRFSGLLGTLERWFEVAKADLEGSAAKDHHIGNYVSAVQNWYDRNSLKGGIS